MERVHINDADRNIMLDLLEIPVVQQQIIKELNKISKDKSIYSYDLFPKMEAISSWIDEELEKDKKFLALHTSIDGRSILIDLYPTKDNQFYIIFDPSGLLDDTDNDLRIQTLINAIPYNYDRFDSMQPRAEIIHDSTFLTVMSHFTGIKQDKIASFLIGLVELVRSDQYIVTQDESNIIVAEEDTLGARKSTCILMLDGNVLLKCRDSNEDDIYQPPDITSSEILDDVLSSGFYMSTQLQDLLLKACGKNESARACIWSNVIGYDLRKEKLFTRLEASVKGKEMYDKYDSFDTSLFSSWLEACDQSIPIVGVAVSIRYNRSSGHKNMLVINRKKKCIEHYEPNGSGHSEVIIALSTLMKVVLPEYTYIPPQVITPMLHGVQSIQQDILLPGACSMWCLWYLHLRIENPDIEPSESIADAIESAIVPFDVGKTSVNLDLMIRAFATKMLSLLKMEKVTTKITKYDGDIIKSGEDLGQCIHVPNTNYYIRCKEFSKETNEQLDTVDIPKETSDEVHEKITVTAAKEKERSGFSVINLMSSIAKSFSLVLLTKYPVE